MPGKTNVLVVEDDERGLAELSTALTRAAPEVCVEAVSTERLAYERLEEEKPDLLVLSLDLAGCAALKLLRKLARRAGFESLPIVVVAADRTDPRLKEAMTLGAAEALLRPVRPVELAGMLSCLTRYWHVLPKQA